MKDIEEKKLPFDFTDLQNTEKCNSIIILIKLI
jgi:hypothetical protein